jgi:chemotaxis protein MotB
MVTYGDMTGLLLVYFVFLISFSSINQAAFKDAFLSLQGALGVLDKPNHVVGTASRSPRRTPPSVTRIEQKLQNQMQALAKQSEVRIEFDKEGGLKISLPNRILFGSGSADLLAQSYPIVDELAEALRDVPGAFIEVRGHTDDRPISFNTSYRDNHALSYARADTVARRLNESGRIPLYQFEITACGPSQPVAANSTPEGQEANRRVEIYVRGAFNRNKIEALRRRVEAEPRIGVEQMPSAGPNGVTGQ